MPILDKVRIILDQITTLISRSDPSLARRVSNSMAMSLLQQLVAIKTMMFNIVQDSCHILCHYDEQNHHHGHHLGQVLGPVLGGLNLQATGRTLPHDEDPEVVHNKAGCCIHCKIKTYQERAVSESTASFASLLPTPEVILTVLSRSFC